MLGSFLKRLRNYFYSLYYPWALHDAAFMGHTETVRVLLERGADVNARDIDENTPLHKTAFMGRIETVRVLLEKGADVHASNNERKTPLHYAAGNGHTEIVRALIERNMDVNAIDIPGITSLHYAAGNGHTGAARVLLEGGADVNTKRESGDTPLHHAALYGHTEIVRVLIRAGANIHAANNCGETPIVCAFEQGRHDIVRLLEERGAQLPERLREAAQQQGFQLNNPYSTHTASVHQCVSESTLALSAHYQGEDLNQARTRLLQWANSLMIKRADLVQRSVVHLIALDYTDPRSNISIRDVLALVWLGVNDIEAQKDAEDPAERICFSMEKIRQENPTLTDEQVKEKFNQEVKRHITIRQERLINCLCEIQREYNKSEDGDDLPSCESGSFNALIYVLHGGHAKVKVWYANNESVILRAFLLFKNQVESLPIELRQKVASLWKAGKDDWLTQVFALQQFTNAPSEIRQALHDEFDSFNLREEIIDETINDLVYRNFPEEFEPFLNAIKSEEPEIMADTSELASIQEIQILNQFSLEQKQERKSELTIDEEGEKRATKRARMR